MSADAPQGRRAAADIAVQVVARGGNLVLGIVVTIVLVRTMGDDTFGRWTTLLAVNQIASVFVELGLQQAVVALAARDPDRESAWVGALIGLRILISIPVTIVATIVSALLADSGEMVLAGALMSATLLTVAPTAMKTFNQLRIRNDVTMLVLTINSVLWGIAVVLLAVVGGSLVAYAGAFLIVTTLSAAAQAAFSVPQMRQRLRIARELWGEILRAGLPLGLAGVLVTMSSRAPQLFVFELGGTSQAGLYGAASRLFEQSHFIPMAVMTTLLPIMSVAHSADPARARRVLQVSLDYLLLAALPAVPLTIVASEPILTLLFGAEFAAAAPALPVLMGAFVLVALNYPLDNMVLVLNQQRQLVKIAFYGLLVMLTANLLTVGEYGFKGAAWSVLAAETVVTVLTYRLVAGPLGMKIGQGRMPRILLAGVVQLAVLLGLDAIGAPLGALIAATVVVYPAALILLGGLDVGEVKGLLRRQPPPDLMPDEPPPPPAPGP